mmetsp:Transcript_12723/g.28120  ORF Transcript_12723/g.28120 Transcript_12723/m.28120 type:complete len:381 (+) Transcript_12723:96-1238(+)
MDLRVPREILRRTPSRRDGVPRETEAQLRIFGAELIQRAATLLRLRQVTSVSAAAVFQRFYFRRSFAEFDARVAAAASLLLACKLEETPRRLRDVVLIFYRLRQRSTLSKEESCASFSPLIEATPATPLEGGREVLELKQEVICMERHILRELGFAVSLLLEHPHKYVIQFIKSMVRSPDWLVAELSQTAWNYLNDSMRTVLCCRFLPHEIAAAGIFLAARVKQVKLPSEPPWWELFDTKLEDLKHIARTILRLYRRPRARYIAVCGKNSAMLGELATPFADTPGPLRSPSPDGAAPGGGSGLAVGEAALDQSRIDEMLREQGAAPGAQIQTDAAPLRSGVAAPLPRSSRSRSPKRRVVYLTAGQRTVSGTRLCEAPSGQ